MRSAPTPFAADDHRDGALAKRVFGVDFLRFSERTTTKGKLPLGIIWALIRKKETMRVPHLNRHAFVLGTLSTAFATPTIVGAATPVPGGANQIKAIEGTFNTWAFNGKIRLKVTAVVVAANQDFGFYSPKSGNQIVTLRGLLANGMSVPANPVCIAVLADADGVTYGSLLIFPERVGFGTNNADVNLQPGAATRFVLSFEVPADFVAVKVLIDTENWKPPFRIDLRKAKILTT